MRRAGSWPRIKAGRHTEAQMDLRLRGGILFYDRHSQEIRRALSEMVKQELSAVHDDSVVSRELALQFVVSTFLTVLTWCLEKKPKLTPSQIDAMFRRLLISGIGRSIGAVPAR